MAEGTSPGISIGGEDMSERKVMEISPLENDGSIASPPVPNGNVPSEAMNAYQNNYGDFVFQKITPPDYGERGSLSDITRRPTNIPDFIADFHFIGLARAVDDMMMHRYKGTIDGGYDTPKPL